MTEMTMRIQLAGASAVAVAVVGAAAPALAASAADEAAAVALFDEAKRLTKGGDYTSACPKIAEAQRLHPTAAKLLALGDCYQHVNKLASAWGSFKQAEIAARNAGDAERQ